MYDWGNKVDQEPEAAGSELPKEPAEEAEDDNVKKLGPKHRVSAKPTLETWQFMNKAE